MLQHLFNTGARRPTQEQGSGVQVMSNTHTCTEDIHNPHVSVVVLPTAGAKDPSPRFKVVCNSWRRFKCLFRRTQGQPRRNTKLRWAMGIVAGRLRLFVRFSYGLVPIAGHLVHSMPRWQLLWQASSSKILQLLSHAVGLLCSCEERIPSLGLWTSLERRKKKTVKAHGFLLLRCTHHFVQHLLLLLVLLWSTFSTPCPPAPCSRP